MTTLTALYSGNTAAATILGDNQLGRFRLLSGLDNTDEATAALTLLGYTSQWHDDDSATLTRRSHERDIIGFTAPLAAGAGVAEVAALTGTTEILSSTHNGLLSTAGVSVQLEGTRAFIASLVIPAELTREEAAFTVMPGLSLLLGAAMETGLIDDDGEEGIAPGRARITNTDRWTPRGITEASPSLPVALR